MQRNSYNIDMILNKYLGMNQILALDNSLEVNVPLNK